jgi:superfamily II DNA or RNA helicase
MYPFLEKIGQKPLESCLRRICARQGTDVPQILDRSQVYSVLFALAGFDLLHESEVRHLLVESLPGEEIRSLAVKLGVPFDGKVFDVISRICVKPWRVRSPVVSAFAELFGIAYEFLPTSMSRDVSVEVVTPFEPLPPLFDYQEAVSSEVERRLYSSLDAGRFMVQLPTGAGKTRAVLDGVVRWWGQEVSEVTSRAVIWLAHTEELCYQAVDAFVSLWQTKGSRQIRAVRYWGGYRAGAEDFAGAFIVGGYGKLVSLKRRENDIYNRLRDVAGVVVIDEAHRALAPTICDLVNDFAAHGVRVVGLTATPGRSSESGRENKELARLFDSTLVTADSLGEDPVSELQHRGILSQIRRVVFETKINVMLGSSELGFQEVSEDIPNKVLRRLARDSRRNEMISSIVADEVKRGRPTLVFACSVDHARQLALLSAAHGLTASFVDCRMRGTQRRRVVQEFRDGNIDVIFNFGVLSTGFDAPNIQTIIIARPTSSIVLYSQMIGRGLRGTSVGGTEDCILVDMRDNFLNFGGVDEVYDFFRPFWK